MRRIAGAAVVVALATTSAMAQELRAAVISEAEHLTSLDAHHCLAVARPLPLDPASLDFEGDHR